MIDINAIINNAIAQTIRTSVDAYLADARLQIDQRILVLEQRVAELEEKLKTIAEQPKPEVGLSALVAPLVASMVEAKIKAALEAQPKPEVSPVVDMDALRALVTPIVLNVVDAVVENAIEAHQDNYNHDYYDEIAEKVDDLPDFDDFVRGDELEDKVEKAVKNLTFEISVS